MPSPPGMACTSAVRATVRPDRKFVTGTIAMSDSTNEADADGASDAGGASEATGSGVGPAGSDDADGATGEAVDPTATGGGVGEAEALPRPRSTKPPNPTPTPRTSAMTIAGTSHDGRPEGGFGALGL